MATEQLMYIDGRWETGASFTDVVNPATEQVIARVPNAGTEQVDLALKAAGKAQRQWAKLSGIDRGRILRRWGDLVASRREELALLLSQEQGKPLREALGEIDFGGSWLNYYAEFDRRIEGEILPADSPDEQIWIVRAPVGVVAGIIPWNYPSAVAIRKIAPALIAGNSIVLKPHEDTPLSALALMRLAEEAGVPPGVVNVVTGPGATVGEALVRSPIPKLVTFTGSLATGKRVMRVAAENVTSVSLELGGKAPFIVMDDCDLDAAIEAAVFSRFLNCGQVCICNERTYVHRAIADRFLSGFLERVAHLRVGNPLDPATDLGPKVNRAELEKVERYVEDARSSGAGILTGGVRPSGEPFEKGFWFSPTVISNVRQDMPIMQEEVFGPVIPVMEISSFGEAIAAANDSKYGLAAYLFTSDLGRVMNAVRDLECGELYVNRGPGESIHGYHSGWKHSGVAGDDGKHGLDHYLQKKTVYLRSRG